MIEQTKTIYYCEHCLAWKAKAPKHSKCQSRHYHSKYQCAKHEKTCVFNYHRECWRCKDKQDVLDAISALHEHLDAGVQCVRRILESLTGLCPACTLAIVVQHNRLYPEQHIEFDYERQNSAYYYAHEHY